MAGNTGFMRQQILDLNTQEKWEFGAAVGMAGNNPGTIDSDLELGKSPTYSARASYALPTGRVGASAIYSRLKYVSKDNSIHDSYGYNLFLENAFAETTVKSKAYYGQNLANIGTLALGKGTSTTNVREFGATLTVAHKLTPKHVPFGGIGLAKVDNRHSITPYDFHVGTKTIAAPGIR